MKIEAIKFDKIKIFFKKLPRFLGERAFFTFLGLLFIFLIFAAFLFYKYIFLVERVQPEIAEEPLQFNEKLFQEILEKFDERERKFKETDLKQYPNPFAGTVPVEEKGEGELTE